MPDCNGGGGGLTGKDVGKAVLCTVVRKLGDVIIVQRLHTKGLHGERKNRKVDHIPIEYCAEACT